MLCNVKYLTPGILQLKFMPSKVVIDSIMITIDRRFKLAGTNAVWVLYALSRRCA